MSELRITLVQADLHWEDPVANRQMLEELLVDVTGSDLIVLPEMFSTGFTMNAQALAEPMERSETVAWMREQASRTQAVITGSIVILDDGVCYNRMIWATPQGELRWYDKRHLFRMAGEHERYGMGRERVIVELNGFKILLSVCYDLRFPVWSRNVGNEYDLMLCVANWPSARRIPWRTLLQARAIENQCYVIGVNRVGEDGKGLHYSGDSMLVDYLGEPLIDDEREISFVRTGVIGRESLEAFRAKFPAWMDADRFTISP